MTSAGIVVLCMLAATVLEGPAEFVLRAGLWFLGGVAATLVLPRRRGEPAVAWLLLGFGALLVGASWAARVLAPSVAAIGAWPDALSGAGLALCGVGLLLVGRSRRQRIALLDGAILAGAVVAFTWSVIVAPQISEGVTTGAVGSAALHLAGGTLVLSVGVAIALAGRGRGLGRSTVWASVGVVATLLASIGWAYQGLAGATQALPGASSWLVAPSMLALVAVAPDPVIAEAQDTGTRLTSVRFLLLLALALLPGITVGIINGVPDNPVLASVLERESVILLGIWMTISSVLLLGARIWASTSFTLEDERAAQRLAFQRLIEHSTDVVCLLSSTGEVFYASPSVESVLGRDPSDLLGRAFDELVEREDRAELANLVELCARHHAQALPLRLRVLDADGRARPAEGTITDLRDVEGVAGIAVTMRDISTRVELEEELTRAALHDPLTGLANRTLLTDRIREALARDPAADEGIGLLFVDLDDFKTVNDGLGHAAGDRVLQVVAERIRAVTRETDTAARLGGDEFAILLDGMVPDDAEPSATTVAARLIEVMDAPIEVAGEDVRVRLSVGLAMARPGMDDDELIHDADVAMYAAKNAGGHFATWDAGMASRARRRLLLTRDLEAALAAGELEVRYQPILEMSSGDLVGAEALMRWTHPRLGSIPADEVEDLAVRGGLADAMTAWLFERVGADRTRWEAAFGDTLPVGVNLASGQLTEAVVDLFDRVFGGPDSGPPCVQIELTESAVLRDPAATARVLGRLRDRGATIAIDDFGTGYASLSYLRRLPVDVVKIDREFVAELDPSNVEGSFASLIQDLAERLGLQTVAEGIETRAQEDAVRALGCEYGQGYLYGRAVPLDVLVRRRADADASDVRIVLPELGERPATTT